MHDGDYLSMGSPDKQDKVRFIDVYAKHISISSQIFIKLYRGTDTNDHKRFQIYIYHTGYACRNDKEPCFRDWRKDTCNRVGY